MPVFGGVLDLVAGNKSGGLGSNRGHFAGRISSGVAAAESCLDLFFDPQTSGGLFVALLSRRQADRATARALSSGGRPAARVGRVVGTR